MSPQYSAVSDRRTICNLCRRRLKSEAHRGKAPSKMSCRTKPLVATWWFGPVFTSRIREACRPTPFPRSTWNGSKRTCRYQQDFYTTVNACFLRTCGSASTDVPEKLNFAKRPHENIELFPHFLRSGREARDPSLLPCDLTAAEPRSQEKTHVKAEVELGVYIALVQTLRFAQNLPLRRLSHSLVNAATGMTCTTHEKSATLFILEFNLTVQVVGFNSDSLVNSDFAVDVREVGLQSPSSHHSACHAEEHVTTV